MKFLIVVVIFVQPLIAIQEEKISQIVKSVKPSIVYIEISAIAKIDDKTTLKSYTQNGVIINQEGYILTSYISSEIVSQIKVYLNSDEYPATLIGNDKLTRIAIIKISEPKKKFLQIKFSKKEPAAGNWATGIYLLDKNYQFKEIFWHKMINGIIPQGISNVIYFTDEKHGYTGMPIVNSSGELIGIAVRFYYLGLSFTETKKEKLEKEMRMMESEIEYVSIGSIKNAVRKIIKKNSNLEISWLGFNMQSLSKAQAEGLGIPYQGVVVTKVFKGSPAEKCGLKEKDVIFEIDGEEISTEEQAVSKVSEFIKSSPAEEELKIKIRREGKELELSSIPAKFPEPQQLKSSFLGLTVQEVDDILYNTLNLFSDKGMLVVDIDRGGPAAQAKINVHDQITYLHAKAVENISAWKTVTEQLKNKKAIVVQLYRGNETITRIIKPALGAKK